MTRSSLYCGPGKVYMSTIGLWPEGVNGQIELTLEQGVDEVATGMHGRVDATQGDCVVRLRMTPFDRWEALSLLYPARVKTPAIGTRIFGATDTSCKVYTPDGRLYTILAAAVTRHPELHLGVGKALYGPIEITGAIADDKAYGDTSAYVSITESGGADPGGSFALSDFIRGRWTGVWGTVEGFGGGVDDEPMEAEDEWTLVPDIRYSALKVQGLTREMQLASVSYLVRVRPVGPMHSEIVDAMKIQGGGTLGELKSGIGADLVLTGPSGKTITLNGCALVGAGFEFGAGERLGTGEIGFVASADFTGGAINPLLTFSA